MSAAAREPELGAVARSRSPARSWSSSSSAARAAAADITAAAIAELEGLANHRRARGPAPARRSLPALPPLSR